MWRLAYTILAAAERIRLKASRPTVDPDADAKRYMSGNETSSDQRGN
jgi:hypothetical protein